MDIIGQLFLSDY